MTAPALPGAAPDPAPGRNDPARLPPEVEKALFEFRTCVEVYGAEDGGFRRIDPREVALRAAIRAALDARALGGDGEPVAWGVLNASGRMESHTDTDAEARQFAAAWNGVNAEGSPFRVVPLYTRPAATGAPTVEAALAALDVEAVDRKDSGVTVHEIVGLDDVRAAHRAKVERLAARVARLEAALRYYADLDAHGARLDVYESNYTGDPADVELDRGDKARAALEDKP